jgi:hypothetical protein
MTPKNEWFEVDKAGLASQIEEPPRLGLELWQNAADEKVTKVAILITPSGERGIARLVVEDDSPEGFSDLTESYKLFAPSKKRSDPTKRGRMNIGEKRVLSLCREAVITSTTGRVIFRADGTRQSNPRAKTPAGTRFEASIRWTKEEQEQAIFLLRSVLVPEGVELMVNGVVVPSRPAVREIPDVTLNTVLPDENGNLRRRTRRKTTIRLVEPQGAELPTIYELGIPVVEHDGKFHIDVMQRVPLNTERDNVPPGYLKELREYVLNASHDLLEPDDAHSTWVADALPNASPEALRSFVKARYGDKVVVRDNSDVGREATLRAIEQGYAVIEGRHLPKGVVGTLREHGIVQPAGEIKSLRRTVDYDPDGPDRSIPEEQWTAGMRQVADYTRRVGVKLLGYVPGVRIERYPFTKGNHLANFGGRTMTYNYTRLGKTFFEAPDQREVDKLILHEFAHDKAINHFSDEFIHALERLGAELRHTGELL